MKVVVDINLFILQNNNFNIKEERNKMELNLTSGNSEPILVYYEAVLDWFYCIHNDDGTLNKDVKDEQQGFINELSNFKL